MQQTTANSAELRLLVIFPNGFRRSRIASMDDYCQAASFGLYCAQLSCHKNESAHEKGNQDSGHSCDERAKCVDSPKPNTAAAGRASSEFARRTIQRTTDPKAKKSKLDAHPRSCDFNWGRERRLHAVARHHSPPAAPVSLTRRGHNESQDC